MTSIVASFLSVIASVCLRWIVSRHDERSGKVKALDAAGGPKGRMLSWTISGSIC
jgi:hypothetical protein